ncbi:serum paraoxonase/arylesterase 2-like [Patiria miniata]|uniref:Paraoxonase n=1 Tax=Patiria miniata TaxID=46514 RepID=A0A913Z5D1_PATMI|nr:serum paraoxonase/arylesterase 2-like [Patiria miniata]
MAGILLKATLFVVFVACLQFGIKVALMVGVHRHSFNHTPGPCRVVPGIDLGSEDISATSSGIAFISSGLKFSPADWARESEIKSRIFTFDFNHPERNVSEVSIKGESFDKEGANYLGLSIWEDKNTGKVTLFVVNRAKGGSSVELFEYTQGTNTLVHKETVTSESIYSPNDVVAVSARRFYITNDFSKFKSFLEILSPIPTGTVAYYDGEKARIVATGFAMANGINQSPDGKYVYVAGAFDNEVNIFEKNKDGSLTLLKKLNMFTTVDNIEVDRATGALWIGCHHQPYKMLMGDENDRNKGTAQVLKVVLDKDLNADVREVLMDDGQLLARGSSVASTYGQQMLVGTVKNKMLYCQLLAY